MLQPDFFSINDLLRSNPYDSLVNGLQTAYVVGRVNVEGKNVYSPSLYGDRRELAIVG
jgi:hypothetical protein